MSREIVVLGSGGHAKVVISAIRSRGDIPIAVYDDSEARHGEKILGVPIVGFLVEADQAARPGVIAIGNNRVREKISQQLLLEWVTIVHATAWVDPSVQLGKGTVVFAGAIVQPDSKIGSHVILNTASSVDHDSVIEDFVQIAPGVHMGGNVNLRQGAFVGVGASIIQGRTVGSWATVGAGAAVIRDIEPGVTAVGVPTHTLA